MSARSRKYHGGSRNGDFWDKSILGSLPDAPAVLLVSMEVDLYPFDEPDKADLIDGCIGELSPFHHAFGYYGHGVGSGTAILPTHWESRLIRLENANTGGTVGWCLSALALAVRKLFSGVVKPSISGIAMVRTLMHLYAVGHAEHDHKRVTSCIKKINS